MLTVGPRAKYSDRKKLRFRTLGTLLPPVHECDFFQPGLRRLRYRNDKRLPSYQPDEFAGYCALFICPEEQRYEVYRFEASVVLGFSIRAESEIEARRIAVDLAIGKIDYAGVRDATLSGRPPHLINLIAVYDLSRQLPITSGSSQIGRSRSPVA